MDEDVAEPLKRSLVADAFSMVCCLGAEGEGVGKSAAFLQGQTQLKKVFSQKC